MTIECAFHGRIGQPPAQRTAKNGNAYATFSVAIAGEGEDSDRVQWINVSAFGDLVATVASLDKGERVYCEGRLRLNEWTDKSDGRARVGLNVTATLVQPLGRIGNRRPTETRAPGRRGTAAGADYARPLGADRRPAGQAETATGPGRRLDDEIAF